MEQQKTPGTYHHGNVKNALVDAAMGLMEYEDIENLSLRRLAREVGVTPSAVYNHFTDKKALMAAIKRKAFEEFNDYFELAVASSQDCEATLRQMALAYYRYSRQYPTRFAVLFTGNQVKGEIDAEFLRLSCRTINLLRAVIVDICCKYQIPCSEEQVVNTVLIQWAQLHGLITLKDSGSILASVGCQGWPRSCSLITEQDTENLILEMIDRLLAGIMDSRKTPAAVQ